MPIAPGSPGLGIEPIEAAQNRLAGSPADSLVADRVSRSSARWNDDRALVDDASFEEDFVAADQSRFFDVPRGVRIPRSLLPWRGLCSRIGVRAGCIIDVVCRHNGISPDSPQLLVWTSQVHQRAKTTHFYETPEISASTMKYVHFNPLKLLASTIENLIIAELSERTHLKSNGSFR
jgi:hypothetical protein